MTFTLSRTLRFPGAAMSALSLTILKPTRARFMPNCIAAMKRARVRSSSKPFPIRPNGARSATGSAGRLLEHADICLPHGHAFSVELLEQGNDHAAIGVQMLAQFTRGGFPFFAD